MGMAGHGLKILKPPQFCGFKSRKIWSFGRHVDCAIARGPSVHGADSEAAFRKGYFLAFRPPTSLRSGWLGWGEIPIERDVVSMFWPMGEWWGFTRFPESEIMLGWLCTGMISISHGRRAHPQLKGRCGWIGSQTQVNGPSQILDTRVKLRPRQVGQVGNKMFPPFSLQPIISYYNYNRLPQ